MSVNATACAPARVAPVQETRVWTEYLGTATRAPSAGQRLAASPTSQWVTQIGRAAVGGLALGDSVIAAQAADQYLTVVDRADGQRRWRKRLDGPGGAGPLISWDVLYAASSGPEGRVYALALRTGDERWSRQVGAVVGPLATFGPQVFVAVETGIVHALATERGTVAWRAALHGVIRSGVSVIGRELIVATDDSLFALALEDGHRLRSTAFPATLSPPAVAGDTLIFVTPGGDALAVRRLDFTTLWRLTLGPVYGNPAVARDTLFAVTVDGTLWRVPLASPSDATSAALDAAVRAGPAPIEGGVLVATVGGEILRPAGPDAAAWHLRIDGPIEQPPLVDGGSLIAVDGHGRIHLWK